MNSKSAAGREMVMETQEIVMEFFVCQVCENPVLITLLKESCSFFLSSKDLISRRSISFITCVTHIRTTGKAQ